MNQGNFPGGFPNHRPRRLRQSDPIRKLVRENSWNNTKLILPFFVREGSNIRLPVSSMPGVFQLSVDELLLEVENAYNAGIRSVLLFGIPDEKDDRASQAHSVGGIVQKAVRALKQAHPTLLVITDVCLCEYMSHGHCGIVDMERKNVENDSSLEILSRVAVSHAEAGADIVAPSDMMDGRVRAIRTALDGAGFASLPIMSYAAKFASSFYGPFREAAESTPRFGDRLSYQMDYFNGEEAIREVALDIAEGADIVMVKPGIAYLDLVYRVKQTFQFPTAVYAVSGEYSMVKAAAKAGWIDERAVSLESFFAMRRAGADIIISYAARELIRWLKELE